MEFLPEVGHELGTHKFLSDLFIGGPNHITSPLFIDYNLPVLPLPNKFTLFVKHIFFLN